MKSVWIGIFERVPDKSGTYPVKLFTGVERTAYWTGFKWVSSERSKGRQNNATHLNRLLRYWKDMKTLSKDLEGKKVILKADLDEGFPEERGEVISVADDLDTCIVQLDDEYLWHGNDDGIREVTADQVELIQAH